MSRPVVARLPSFSPFSGPSDFDEALVASSPIAIFHSTLSSLSMASSIDDTRTRSNFYWPTVSSVTNMTLSNKLFPAQSDFERMYGIRTTVSTFTEVKNMLRNAYNPFGIVEVNSMSQFITTQDGIYNVKLNVNCVLDTDFVADDNVSIGLQTNGTFETRLDTYFQGETSLSSTSGIQLYGQWTGPLNAGTTISLYFEGSISAPNKITVGAWDGSQGAQCVITRESTLVHVVTL